MGEELKPKRGAPRGNQNARKHGFYSRVLDDIDRRNLKKAALMKGIDEEIDLLRVKLKSVLEHDSENIRLISYAAVSLARLLRTRHYLLKTDDKTLRKAVENVFTDIAFPMGVDIVKFINLSRNK